jgi:hypothetical protein
MPDTEKLQARIDASLLDPETGRPWVRFSPYLSSMAIDLQDKLEQARKNGGFDSMMDEFDRLLQSEDRNRLRAALATVLFRDPLRAKLGLRIP